MSDNTIQGWGEKPYYSLDFYLKETFGQKIYKLALDAGMTCPNRDGTLDTRGCIFCSKGGSGDFATKQAHSVTQQIDDAITFLQTHDKKTGQKYIAYFQSYSNTYAPVKKLRACYIPALQDERICALSIATRPDCFSESIYDLLSECNQIKPVWVELGLQTIHEKTALKIRRGYPLSCFEQTVKELQKRNIPVIVHIILGLPGESTKEVLETIEYLNALGIQGIKLQLLHILKDTDLAKELPTLSLLSEEEYIALLLQCIAHLSPDIVIHRLTGDGPKELLLAPLWSLHKRHVLNRIAHQLKEEQVYQGMDYQKKK